MDIRSRTLTVGRPSQSPRTQSKIIAIGFVAVLVSALAACSPASDPVTSTEKTTPTAEVSREDWQLQFAACMREQGFDMPDPIAGAGGMASAFDPAQVAEYEKLSPVCIDKIGDAPAAVTGDVTADEYFQNQLDAAECLRENGFDVADPVKGEGFTFPQGVSDAIAEECVGAPLGSPSTTLPGK